MRNFFAAVAAVAFLPAVLAQAADATSTTVSPTEAPAKINPGTVSEGGLGTSTDPGVAGAAGPDSGGIHISTGGIIGIAVGIAVAVIGIGVMWFLWYMAKKRSWDVRSSIRRVSRRLTGGISAKRKSNRTATRLASPPRDRDVEKGYKESFRPEKSKPVANVKPIEMNKPAKETKNGDRNPQTWRSNMARDGRR
ncbi:hypothetical protein P152DRAFT_457844 [Eremomyces bilateralis CBS 781.70]|uniref:Mid2 domain-containing protein n=1 Tax=Eremomyces bilateralis CBS 781.70 TaxID=1392243 RepID=A0A6G1G637_9PEZI|nr:uncharacterized protein P152DRAFT_457844 [Eremomyces bilateralis CBS 781.70]KAF1813482.1 hypothetical protein P152DRAFT_457844 [Eremomyces bilateralis CBS 781.70]